MAAITSASTVTALLRQTPSGKSSSLASSSSVFFSYDLGSPARIGLSMDRRRPHGTATTKRGLSCNCLFGLGVPELAVIVGVAALVFGPKQLPEVGRSIGKTVKSFQQAAKEFETELKKDDDKASAEPSGDKTMGENEEKKQQLEEAKVPNMKESS